MSMLTVFTANSYDYTKGKLDELVTIIIDSGAKLFVSAVGVPPAHVVQRLHKAGILYMNMIGHPKHVQKCLDVGADMICAQGGEGGGHTGDVPTTILIPTVAQMCRGKKSPLTGSDVQVVAAGGLFNGQSLAAALMLGANAVWIGTRFVLSEEAGAPKAHQEAVRTSGFDDNVRTIIFTVSPFAYPKNVPFSPRTSNDLPSPSPCNIAPTFPNLHNRTETRLASLSYSPTYSISRYIS